MQFSTESVLRPDVCIKLVVSDVNYRNVEDNCTKQLPFLCLGMPNYELNMSCYLDTRENAIEPVKSIYTTNGPYQQNGHFVMYSGVYRYMA